MALDKRAALAEARKALESKRPERALEPLLALLDRAQIVDAELHGHLRLLAGAYTMLERPRAAATLHLFVGELDRAEKLAAPFPTDAARVLITRGRHADAAKKYLDARWPGHAALQLERAGDDRAARVLWERLADDVRLRDDLYTQALVRFNLGRACARLNDTVAARRATVESMHLLEAAADQFEQRGLRERAFDCYAVLLTMGRAGAFENLAEGYLNCIRILREDHLKYFVLQYFEDFQKLSLDRDELIAAATLFREASQFCRLQHLPYERHYKLRAAETHVAAAQQIERKGGSPEMQENALASAIDCFNDLGLYSRVRGVYGVLSRLALGEKRQARYARLRARLEGVSDSSEGFTAFPEYLRLEAAYPEIWNLDVIEWEQAGDAAETMGEVLLSSKWPDFTRKRALQCRLAQLGAGEVALSPATLESIAKHLGHLALYAGLAPLEKLAQHPEGAVRAACLRAVRQLYYKRSFVLVNQGLRDPEPQVRREALAAVGQLHFPHSFDPLARIHREATEPEVRRAALTSIGMIASLEAVEFLVGILRHGDAEEQQLARGLLARNDLSDVVEQLRRVAQTETGAVKAVVEQVLRQRGVL